MQVMQDQPELRVDRCMSQTQRLEKKWRKKNLHLRHIGIGGTVQRARSQVLGHETSPSNAGAALQILNDINHFTSNRGEKDS
jgi:hypothetical protein